MEVDSTSATPAASATSKQQVTVLRKQLDNESEIAGTLLESVEATSPAQAAGLGRHLDVKA